MIFNFLLERNYKQWQAQLNQLLLYACDFLFAKQQKPLLEKKKIKTTKESCNSSADLVVLCSTAVKLIT
jgi:hypothetical protein